MRSSLAPGYPMGRLVSRMQPTLIRQPACRPPARLGVVFNNALGAERIEQPIAPAGQTTGWGTMKALRLPVMLPFAAAKASLGPEDATKPWPMCPNSTSGGLPICSGAGTALSTSILSGNLNDNAHTL